MGEDSSFRLSDTPPQGNVFPAAADATVKTSTTELAIQHKRNPSHPILTIDTTRAGSGSKTQTAAAPPPARSNAAQTAAPPPPPPPPPPPAVLPRISNELPLRRPAQDNRLSIASYQALERSAAATQYNPAANGDGRESGLSQYPAAPAPAVQAENHNRYSASIYSTARPAHAHNNSLSHAFAASSDPVHAPLPSYRESMMDVPAVIQSSPSDVLDLWLLACGQDTQDIAICYNLGLECGAELICLTSTGGTLYALAATANGLNVIRTHPLAPANIVSIATPSLYTPNSTSSLVTSVFPVLSKIRAIDEAASVTLTHGLSRMDALALEREFITKAHATTAAPLMLNPQTGGYCLSLPVFSEHGDSVCSHHTLPIEISPNVSIRILEPASSATGIQNPVLTYSIPAKTLIVHAPALVALPSPYAVDILLSSILVLLLHLHRSSGLFGNEQPAPTHAPTHAPAHAPPAQQPAPITVPTFAPPPLVAVDARGRSRSAVRSTSTSRGRSASRSRGPSRLGALLHPARARSALSSHPVQQESENRSASRLSTFSTHSNSMTLRASPPLPSSNTIAPVASNGHGNMRMEFAPPPGSFDVEKGFNRMAVEEIGGMGSQNKELSAQGTAPELDGRNTGLDLSRFQAYDLADPRLGTATRLMLRFLYWGFGVFVWILGVFVGIMAEGIVLVTTCGSGGSGRD